MPATDETNTQVTVTEDRFDVQGGLLSAEGDNLFFSLEQFNLEAGQVANFLTPTTVQNVLSRVVGGDASMINGLIQVIGSQANLYLMNPAGIVFGAEAQLNVPALFAATTAGGIGFDQGWFKVSGENDYASLTGTPTGFDFTGPTGSLINLGNLAVGAGQSLLLVGNTVINQGTLSAPGGNITLMAVAGSNRVRISQSGMVLSLEVEADTGTITPTNLSAALTGAAPEHALTLQAGADGQMQLTGSALTLVEPGTALVTGSLEVSGQTGGQVQILGQQVALRAATVNASGVEGGGTVQVGGGYQGEGPTAAYTLVDAGSRITADALESGDGGQVIVWSDRATQFLGQISAQGVSGDGGLVEVSGKETLGFGGAVDLRSQQGQFGTLLLDPTDIEIRDGSGVGTNDGLLPNIFFSLLGSPFILYEATLEELAGDANVQLQATNNITLANLSDDILAFQPGTGAISFLADADRNDVGSFVMDPGDTLQASGRSLSISAASITAGNIDTSSATPGNSTADGGAINLTATAGGISTGDLITSSQAGNNNAGTGGSITLLATGDITTGQLETFSAAGQNNDGNGGNILARSDIGNLATGDINIISQAGQNNAGTAGSVTLAAPNGSLTTGSIDASTQAANSNIGDGGNVFLEAAEDIVVRWINTESATNGGIIDLSTQQFFRATDSFTAADNSTASLSALGNDTSGFIDIQYQGAGTTPFEIGSAATNGTVGAIVTGDTLLLPFQSLTSGETTGDTLRILDQGSTTGGTTTGGTTTGGTTGGTTTGGTTGGTATGGTTGGTTGGGTTGGTATGGTTGGTATGGDTNLPGDLDEIGNQPETTPLAPEFEEPPPSTRSADKAQPNSIALPSESAVLEIADPAAAFTEVETALSQQFADYLGMSGGAFPETSLETAQTELQALQSHLGLKPALIYIYFVGDELELMMITAKGQPLRQRVNVTRSQVEPVVKAFQQSVASLVMRPKQYLPPAQQLYQWLIAPLESELKQQDIQNLAFVLDTGLRSVPLAALHDGEHFLVESYSLGLLPTFGLTDFRQSPQQRENLGDESVLAMGIADFQDQFDLSAVPQEIELVSQGKGQAYLNEAFTLDNLQNQLQQNHYGIVHLATHAVFRPGAPENSYLQLWDQQLYLNQLADLKLGESTVPLLVLSACTTALGDKDAEFGFAGLAVRTGVQSVLASLWAVSDEGTLGFMAEFYRQLEATSIRSEALRQAQISLLRGEVDMVDGLLTGAAGQPVAFLPELASSGRWDFTHPAYWAAFTMIGNPW
jgi:filamentous hemagglutinin family protein